MDDMGVRRLHGEKIVESVEWSHLTSVAIRTTSGGPFGEDVYWLLMSDDQRGVAVPQGIAPDGLLDRLRALPDFDDAAVIAAMGSTSHRLFHCWGEPVAER